MSTVRVIKSNKTGQVINKSTRNPEEGWVMVESKTEEWKGGRRWENKRTGFLRQTVATLQALDLKAEFKSLGVGEDLVVLQPKGFAEGQLLPGRVVIQDQLVPIMKDNAEFGLRIPQTGNNADTRKVVRDACTAHGIRYEQSGHPIYRKTFYSPFPAGHEKYEADIILSPDNLEAIQAFIATLPKAGSNPDTDKAARLAQLKGIAKAKRTEEEKAELAMLVAELED